MKNEKHTIHELEIKYLPSKIISKPEKITSSDSAFKLLKNVFNPDTIACQEEFIVLYLNHGNYALGTYRVAIGGISSTIADIRLILSVALKCLASAIIISHNHPSGTLLPSRQDLLLTKKMNDACNLLEIVLLDHIIVSPSFDFYSMKDENQF